MERKNESINHHSGIQRTGQYRTCGEAIPAYNEEENIENVVSFIQKKYSEYDYVVVNDGSKDHTADICRKKGYELLNLPVNLGLAGAFQAGLKYAYAKGYSYAIQFDADGQHRPEYIAAMIRKIEEGNDIVIASRFVEEKKPATARMIGSRLITTAIRLTSGAKIMDPTSGMRMYNKKLIEVLANNINFGPEPDTVSYLIKMGAKVAEIQAKMDERIAGQSYLNAVNAAKYMARMLISILLIQNFRNKKKVDFTK